MTTPVATKITPSTPGSLKAKSVDCDNKFKHRKQLIHPIHQAIKMAIAGAAAKEAVSVATSTAASVFVRSGITAAASSAVSAAIPAITVGCITYGVFSMLFKPKRSQEHLPQ